MLTPKNHVFEWENMMRVIALMLIVALAAALSACTTKPTPGPSDIEDLAAEIQGLGPDVDPEEASRAAHIAYTYSQQLAQEYRVTDPPLIHNAKVMHGFRERGLCNDWAQDIQKRLNQENFRTLTLHWATSPPTDFRIIHHSAVISRRGDTMYDGIILDPWRYGGVLFWSKTKADERYNWRPRMEVREELINASRARQAS